MLSFLETAHMPPLETLQIYVQVGSVVIGLYKITFLIPSIGRAHSRLQGPWLVLVE